MVGVTMVAAFQQQRSDAGLGASEVATAIGLNPYESPFDLWLRKTQQAGEKEETEPMRWGNLLEPIILDEYERRCEPGVRVERCTQSHFHIIDEWCRATPDAWLVNSGETIGVVQIKNVGANASWKWKDAPPDFVALQVQWELYVTGLDRGDIAALLGGNELRVFTVWRDDALIRDLVKAAARFWRYVETRTPPPADESDACREYWSARTGSVVVENDADINALAERLRAAKAKAREAKHVIETTTNQIIQHIALAGASAARTPDGMLTVTKRRGAVSWKKVAADLMKVSGWPEDAAEAYRGDDTHYLRTPRDWSNGDDE